MKNKIKHPHVAALRVWGVNFIEEFSCLEDDLVFEVSSKVFGFEVVDSCVVMNQGLLQELKLLLFLEALRMLTLVYIFLYESFLLSHDHLIVFQLRNQSIKHIFSFIHFDVP
jgi:hypothetical protein